MLSVRKLLLLSSAPILLTACGSAPSSPSGEPVISGVFHGGQQPIAGITIQLYAVGTGGDGTAATPLFSPAITSTAYGNFTFTSYTCPSPTALTYLVGTGGNPGLSSNNPQIALMAVLGPCGSIASLPYISVNELTTVAAVYALAPYITSLSHIGSSSSDASGLASAFTLATQYANSATGHIPGTNLPTNYVVPIAQFNTVADILAACINTSGGSADDGSPCGTFLAMTTPSGATPPTNAISALLNLANNPTLNTSALFGLISSSSPYQSADATQPADLSIALTQGTTPLVFAPTAGLTFPSTNVGSRSAVQNFTIANNNSTDITVSALGIYGANPNDFSVTLGCLQTVAANSVCIMSTYFQPTAPGTRTANFTLTSNASNSPTTMYFTGTGAGVGQAVIALSTTSLTMQNFATGQVKLTNNGTAAATISSITASSGFSQTNTCGTSLGASSSCTVTVSPNQSVSGPFTGALTITSSSTNSPQTVSLNSALTTQNMGTATIGAISPTQFVVTARYPSIQQQFFLQGALSGPDAGDFFFVGGAASCITAKNVSTGCSITLGMKPTAAGSRVALLTLNDQGSTYSYVLDGTGTAGAGVLTVSPSSLTLPATLAGSAATTQAFTLTNQGPGTITFTSPFTSASETGANPASFPISSVPSNSCAATLAPSASCTVNVGFTPAESGSYSAQLTIANNSSTPNLVLPFTGTATGVIGALSASATALYMSLNNTYAGLQSSSPTGAVTLLNHGTAPLTLGTFTTSSGFSQTNNCPSMLAGGASCVLTITPADYPQYPAFGTLTIASNATDPTITVQLASDMNPMQPFGSAIVGQTGQSIPFEGNFQNSYSPPTTSNFQGTITGPAAADFTPANPSCSATFTMTGGGACTATITFSPTASGLRVAYLSGTVGYSYTIQDFVLIGTGN